ncbi:hypothetical protein ACVJBD_000459 [Rhizobium mongolense]
MSSAKVNPVTNPAPTAEEVCRQLERILSSEEFHRPKRGRMFLQFVIGETLAGRSEFLKAFTIANEVFGREASFDPQNDPAVRIEAGRIRRALERYYLVAGQADEVIITVPKGGYVPHFEYAHGLRLPASPIQGPNVAQGVEPTSHERVVPGSRRSLFLTALVLGTVLVIVAAFLYMPAFSVSRAPISGASSAEASQPRVVVGGFADTNAADAILDIGHGLRDEIISQLAKFDDIVVVSDPLRTDHAAAASYTLQGNVQLDGQPPSEHPHGLPDRDFDALFTKNKPIIFAFHGYPWLIHRLTYRRTNHGNLHVRGYKEEGTTTTPFDMVVLNDMDRFHLVEDVIDRLPQLGARAAYFKQAIHEKLVEHRQYIEKYGDDMPAISGWKWGSKGKSGARPRTSTEGDNA